MVLHATILTAVNNSTALNNASSNFVAGFGSSAEIFPAIVLVILLTVGIFIGSSVTRIGWVHEKLKVFSLTFYYAIVGGASVLAAGVVAYPLWKVAQTDAQTKTMALKAIGVLIVGYAALSIIGYVIDRTVLTNVAAYIDQLDSDSEEDTEDTDQ